MPTLSPAHLAAIARRRRLIVNFDVTFAINVQHRRNPDRPDLVEHLFEFADAPGSQIDSIWWNWGEGNQAPYPSQHLPLYDHPLYQKWADEGTDIVGQVLAATQRRGLECFFSHRMNGSDNDLGPFARIPTGSFARLGVRTRTTAIGISPCPKYTTTSCATCAR